LGKILGREGIRAQHMKSGGEEKIRAESGKRKLGFRVLSG